MHISWLRSSLTIVAISILFMSISLKSAEYTKRIVKLDAGKTLLLIQDSKNKTEIVVPDKSDKVVVFAAGELQKFLEQSFKTSVPIVSAPSKNKTSIILGNNSYSRQAGIAINKLPRDGFVIKSTGKNIFIAGKDNKRINPERSLKTGAWGQLFERGTLFGVYDFLERFIGVRFYFPGKNGTIVPKHNSLKIASMDIVEMPDYQQRKISWYSGKWYEGKNRDKLVHPGKNLNYYRLRMSTSLIPNCHGLARLGYLRRFGKTHPEYFAMMSNGKRHNNPALPHPGQLCYSSNVREQIYKDAKAFLSGESAKEAGILTERFGYCWDQSGFQKGYFNIMPQDSFFKCNCAKCQKHFPKGSQATSDFIWNFVREVALKLKKDKVPGYLTMMAYTPYRDLPNVELPDNILVMVAEHGPWGIYNKQIQTKDNKEIRDWVKKMTRKTWLWNYANKFGKREMPGIPQVTPNAIAKYYKSQKPYIFGAYMESETDKYIFNALNYYVFGKVCWDNNTDVDALLDEYYKLMFGPAAKVMKSIDERFEELWLRKIGGRTVDTPLGPMAAPPSEYKIWEKIYSPDELKELTKKFDKAESLAAKYEEALQRVKFIRNEFLDSIINAANAYSKSKNEIEDLTFTVKKVPAGKSIKIDGKLDDPAWAESKCIYLHPYKGNQKNLKTVQTRVYALRGKDKLYFAFKCSEPEIKAMLFSSRKHDDKNIWKDSSIELFLNPSGDRKNYYQFIINPTGAHSDIKSEKMGMEQVLDWNWNSNISVKTTVAAKEWIAEIAIPLKDLPGFNAKGFPANFNRNRLLSKGKGYVNLYTWSPFLKHGFHDLQNFGNIVFGKEGNTSVLDNGDFTATPRKWMLGKWYGPRKKNIKPGQVCELDKSTFIKGGQSLKLVNSAQAKRICVTQYLPQLKPNTKYLLTFYIKTKDLKSQGGRHAGAVVNLWDEKNRWYPQNWFIGSMPWSKQGFEFITGPETNKKVKSYIRLFIIGATGTVWFDDVRLREINN